MQAIACTLARDIVGRKHRLLVVRDIFGKTAVMPLAENVYLRVDSDQLVWAAFATCEHKVNAGEWVAGASPLGPLIEWFPVCCFVTIHHAGESLFGGLGEDFRQLLHRQLAPYVLDRPPGRWIDHSPPPITRSLDR